MNFAYSTSSLRVDFVTPVPVDAVMTLRAHVTAIDEERATVSCSVFVNDLETTRAETQHRRIGSDGWVSTTR